jgi:hypothetical protein
MVQAMGSEVMSASQVAHTMGLGEDPQTLGYISSVFSSAMAEDGQRIFKAVKRGHYQALSQEAREAIKRANEAKNVDAVRWFYENPDKELTERIYCLLALGDERIDEIMAELEQEDQRSREA